MHNHRSWTKIEAWYAAGAKDFPHDRCSLTFRINVEVLERLPKVLINPAACQVVPDVNLSLSNSTTSSTPNFAKWYATDVPMIPPPTTTTFAFLGIFVLAFNTDAPFSLELSVLK